MKKQLTQQIKDKYHYLMTLDTENDRNQASKTEAEDELVHNKDV